MICPKCKDVEMLRYEGCLGYESIKCPKCNLDANDALYEFNVYQSELRAEIKTLKDKVSRRNMQIEDLKKKVGSKTIGEWKASDWEFWAIMEYRTGSFILPEWFVNKMKIK